ncbi:MAG: Na+/H+ antiporter NhaA [Rhizobiales bacterium]|nr:Na+/H+ antiporter NhaA [Hyphomicrobiales bacterium]
MTVADRDQGPERRPIVAYNVGSLRPLYDSFIEMPVSIKAGDFGLAKPLLLWINDGLMAVFFFLVGLELKREVREGNLASRDQLVLPALAAVGGMAVPALIYVGFNFYNPAALKGWAIPSATDIAFALGALSLVGRRAPPALKVFLLTLATLDDLGAIVIIALFYTSGLSFLSLALAGGALAVLLLLNRFRVEQTGLFIVIGIALWVFVLKSGVHATLSGVALALTIPMRRQDGTAHLAALEEALHPYVKFLILPLFAFANAGIPLDGFALANLASGIPAGTALGLLLGKPLGIVGSVRIATALGLARLPKACTFRDMAGVGFLAGIGFTMSLFIGTLAFADPDAIAAVRIGVVAGSVLATLIGVAILVARPASA